MKINIPENHKQQFDKAIEYAIVAQSFTPADLAAHLGTGEFSASIMVGYLEKAGVVTKAKGNGTRLSRLTADAWQELGCCLDSYEPEEITEIYEAPSIEIQRPVYSIDTSGLSFKGKTLSFEDGCFILSDGTSSHRMEADSIAAIYLHRAGIIGNCTLTLSTDGKIPSKAKCRPDTLIFAKRDYDTVFAFAESTAEQLQIQAMEF